jgi:hypothetical protein
MKRRRSRDRPKNNAAEIIIAIVIVITLFALVAQIGSAPADWTSIQVSVPDDPALDIPEEEKPSEPEEKPDIDITDDSESEVTTEKIPFV